MSRLDEIRGRLDACPPIKPHVLPEEGVVLLGASYPPDQAEAVVRFLAASRADVAYLLDVIAATGFHPAEGGGP